MATPNPLSFFATSWGILPKPTSPTVDSQNRDRGTVLPYPQSPSRSALVSTGSFFARASIMATVWSETSSTP